MSRLAARYIVILTGLNVVYFIGANQLGIAGTQAAGWSTYVLYFLVIFVALKSQKQILAKYWRRVLFGSVISLGGAVASAFFMYLYLSYFDDLMICTAVEDAMAALDPGHTDYDVQVQSIRATITPGFYFAFGSIAGTLIGVVISLFAAGFVGKQTIKDQ